MFWVTHYTPLSVLIVLIKWQNCRWETLSGQLHTSLSFSLTWSILSGLKSLLAYRSGRWNPCQPCHLIWDQPQKILHEWWEHKTIMNLSPSVVLSPPAGCLSYKAARATGKLCSSRFACLFPSRTQKEQSQCYQKIIGQKPLYYHMLSFFPFFQIPSLSFFLVLNGHVLARTVLRILYCPFFKW